MTDSMRQTQSKAPRRPGVYYFKNAAGKIIYVGKAKSLKDRLSSYFAAPNTLLPKTAQMVEEAQSLDYQIVESEIDALLLEANQIRSFYPKYNVDWKDGKAYPLIEITKEKVPQVHFVRSEINPKSTYFGPYPAGSDLTGLLRFLRKVFPFVSENHHGNKPCLRSHLGLCPCPKVFTDPSSRQEYLKDLRNLRDFLSGKREVLQKQLRKEMQQASENLDFETAQKIKNRLAQIDFATQIRHSPQEYVKNPNIISDIHSSQIKVLEEVLKINNLHKIECYDIAHTGGKNSTGSQVVFVDGVPEKKFYRRYKIKLKMPGELPNDFAMMAEMISRRLKSDVPLPELMVIDGGKGQLSSVLSVFSSRSSASGSSVLRNSVHETVKPKTSKPISENRKLKSDNINLPKIISLAKRDEIIFTDNGHEIHLPKSSPGLQLLQQLRDEAHRFSRKYHFLLRKKSLFS